LHCSDISNPFKPYELCAKWADLVVEEFFQQGDTEREMGLEISPMCDRNSVALCNMQMGFIEFAVAPLINSTLFASVCVARCTSLTVPFSVSHL
jgi:cAMP-specific phosphodiesterase 4